MKYKFLTLAIAGMMISGANVNATQWETKARNISGRDTLKQENNYMLDYFAYYLDEENFSTNRDIECFSNLIYDILDSVNAENPEKAFYDRWEARDDRGAYVNMLEDTEFYVCQKYNETATQDAVNEFYKNVVKIRNNLEARNPDSPNVARLDALIRILSDNNIHNFVKSYTPLLILLRDKVLTVLNH